MRVTQVEKNAEHKKLGAYRYVAPQTKCFHDTPKKGCSSLRAIGVLSIIFVGITGHEGLYDAGGGHGVHDGFGEHLLQLLRAGANKCTRYPGAGRDKNSSARSSSPEWQEQNKERDTSIERERERYLASGSGVIGDTKVHSHEQISSLSNKVQTIVRRDG